MDHAGDVVNNVHDTNGNSDSSIGHQINNGGIDKCNVMQKDSIITRCISVANHFGFDLRIKYTLNVCF